MTCEEAITFLPWLADIKHSMKRRAHFHNYFEPGLYLLTIVVMDRQPLLGKLEVEPYPYVNRSVLGNEIVKYELPKINEVYPMIQPWRVCVMPDHIHIILRVNEKLPDKKHLGYVIGAFKSGCTRRWWSLSGYNPSTIEQRKSRPLFEVNYNDRIIRYADQLEVWKKYLTDNPRRLALKRAFPGLFTTIYKYEVNGLQLNIFGNRFLLNIPDKMAVIVHRRDTDDEYEAKCRQWLACGERGGVLVSASIAPREQAVMRIAMEKGYNLILLRENGFPNIYKPSGAAFDACSRGQLLQISPWEYHFEHQTISRTQCLILNDIAEFIAKSSPL